MDGDWRPEEARLVELYHGLASRAALSLPGTALAASASLTKSVQSPPIERSMRNQIKQK